MNYLGKTREFQGHTSHDKSTYSGLSKEVKGQLENQSAFWKKINIFNRLLKECKMLTASHGRSWPRDELMTVG